MQPPTPIGWPLSSSASTLMSALVLEGWIGNVKEKSSAVFGWSTILVSAGGNTAPIRFGPTIERLNAIGAAVKLASSKAGMTLLVAFDGTTQVAELFAPWLSSGLESEVGGTIISTNIAGQRAKIAT